ncbi:hypothetical protein [Atlantibacter subterraneus]|uniref:hypothetical protein n=1 Tax=Atlantibacter subterraneus TaxID=255519 RepID=UPI002963E9E1|nr:hypothetical protein [Atlantibacter subterranea]MDW2741888.1 hypothetical protein [Atlantibacter subterranea]
MAFYYTPGPLPFINQKALYVINMTVLKFLIHYWHLLVLVVEINFANCAITDALPRLSTLNHYLIWSLNDDVKRSCQYNQRYRFIACSYLPNNPIIKAGSLWRLAKFSFGQQKQEKLS